MLRCGRAHSGKMELSERSLALSAQKMLLEGNETEPSKALNGLVAVDAMRPERLINPGTWISEPPERTNLLKPGMPSRHHHMHKMVPYTIYIYVCLFIFIHLNFKRYAYMYHNICSLWNDMSLQVAIPLVFKSESSISSILAPSLRARFGVGLSKVAPPPK